MDKYEIGFWFLIAITAFLIYLAHRGEYHKKSEWLREVKAELWKKYYGDEFFLGDKKKKRKSNTQ